MKGRYLIVLIETPQGRRWNIKRPENQTPIASREEPEKFLRELREKRQKYLVWSDGESPPVVYSVRTGKPIRKLYKVAVIKQKLEKGLVYGEVLVPDEVDAQGERASAEEIEQAAHNYLQKGQLALDYKHQRLLDPDDAQLVESWIAPISFEWEGRQVKEGTWLVAVKVRSESLKKEIETGEINSFSIKGLADKV